MLHLADLASALGILAIALVFPVRMMAAVPPVQEILERMLGTIAEIPHAVTADAEFRLRVGKSLNEPPDCVFRGTATVVGGQPTLKIDERTDGLFCWVVNRYVIGQRFEATERLESFLSRFEFDVLGEKLVGNDHYYLVEGKAKDPTNDPNTMVGWIDFDHGLLVESTVGYSWGSIDTEQSYRRMGTVWILMHQYLYTGRFNTSMEILYSNFRFGSP